MSESMERFLRQQGCGRPNRPFPSFFPGPRDDADIDRGVGIGDIPSIIFLTGTAIQVAKQT